MQRNVCSFNEDLIFVSAEESAGLNRVGKLIPKDGSIYKILILADNPDIVNIKLEAKLIRQGLFEYHKRLPYSIKVYTELPNNLSIEAIDVTIEWIEPDDFMGDNTLAYAGYPFGSLRGIIRFNNNYAWLDGHPRTGAELRALGIILPGMIDTQKYSTYSVRHVIKHEFGHTIGLEHDPTREGIMTAIYDFNKKMLRQFSLDELEEKYGLRSVLGRWLSWIQAVMTRRQKF